jgi:hypothetical protein
MAFRLGELVVCGELYNNQKNSVHGVIQLKGQDRPLSIQLTGNCSPDLAGWHFRFERREESEGDKEDERDDLSGLAWEQVGPTGTMTAARKVKVADCSPEELYIRCKAGEPPPMESKPCLTLEWHSQNGRVLIEMIDPILELVEFTELEGVPCGDCPERRQWERDINTRQGGLQISQVEIGDDGRAEIRDVTPKSDDAEADEEDTPAADSYGLIPDELQRALDAQSAETDRALGGEPEDSEDVIREMELLDDLMDSDADEPLGTIFDPPMKLPRPDDLDEEQAEVWLKALLARLALFGIALDMCEHFTHLATYRLLLEKICWEERVFPQLRQTQWVQHFMTSEYCEMCEAQFEAEWEAEHGADEDGGGEAGEGPDCDAADPFD